MKAAFTGGSLSFKGANKKKAKKKKSTTKHSLQEDRKDETKAIPAPDDAIELDDDLTEAEKKAMKRKMEREREELETIAKKSHRERVEEYNQKLAELTEHNDIPRVSAAGNG